MTRRPALLLFLATLVWAQPLKPPVEIFNLVRMNLSHISDYQVDMKIKVAMPGFRMPGKKVHYAFKVPDKVKLETSGFAVVPRQGILPFYNELMNDTLKIAAETLESTQLEGQQVWVVAFQDTFYNQDALIKLWVGDPSGVILKGVATIGGEDVFTLTSEYKNIDDIAFLPMNTKIELKLPAKMKTLKHLNSSPQAKMEMMESRRDTSKAPVEGHIDLTFTKYRVNQGIPDSYFEKKNDD